MSNIYKEIDNALEKHDGKLPVVEIFYSIEGEGKRAGSPTVFIRFAGCNLRCKYCDTKYAFNLNSPEIFWMDIDEIVSEVMKYKCENVTITGGEPLLYQIYITRMIKYMTHLKPDIEVNIETNGTITPLYVLMNMENVFITADQKCPCSGYDEVVPYLSDLREQDVLKFVVADEVDLAFMKKVLIEHKVKAQIFMHPVFGADLQKLAEFIKQNDYLNIRLGIQLHKVIWKPNERWV